MALYLKFLDEGRVAPLGTGTWDLLKNPRDGEPVGKWMPKRKPVLCASGYHASRLQDVSRHVRHGELWLVELRGEIITGYDKVAAESARLVRQLPWDRQMVVSLAADWAEMVAHLRSAANAARAAANAYAANADAGLAASFAARAAAYAAYAANAARADEMWLRQGQRLCEVVGVDPEEIAR